MKYFYAKKIIKFRKIARKNGFLDEMCCLYYQMRGFSQNSLFYMEFTLATLAFPLSFNDFPGTFSKIQPAIGTYISN